MFQELARYPGYCVGSDGTVWSRWRRGPSGELGVVWRKLTPVLIKGHGRVRLKTKSGEFVNEFVSRLVLECFEGPCPEGKVACHEDGNSLDDSLGNLRWDTQQSNVADSVRHGTKARGVQTGTAKLTPDVVLELRDARDRCKLTYLELSTKFNISVRQAHRICTGQSWAHL